MSKSTNAKLSKAQRRRQKPSAPRQIGANDNAALIANDNRPVLAELSREPGVKETPNQRIFRQMLRRALDETPQPQPRYDPSRLTEDQTRRARRAHEQLTSGIPSKEVAGKAALLAIQAEVESRMDAARRANDNAEITSLEEGRGEIVETGGRNEPPGRIKVVSRDAMTMMWKARTVTDLQYQGGLAFRKRYELLDPERNLSPPPIDGTRKSNHDDADGRAAQLQEAMDDLLKFQREVQTNDPTMKMTAGKTIVDRIGLRMFVLREVAGKGLSIRSLAKGARERERMAQALSAALDVAAVHFRTGGEDDDRRPIRVWRVGDPA